ncbi:hypothetical protein [Thermococcus profundus]|nr:hypothetical protein [Thermococcus profundus]
MRRRGGERMEWMMMVYYYRTLQDMKRARRKPIPEELEYVEMLQG